MGGVRFPTLPLVVWLSTLIIASLCCRLPKVIACCELVNSSQRLLSIPSNQVNHSCIEGSFSLRLNDVLFFLLRTFGAPFSTFLFGLAPVGVPTKLHHVTISRSVIELPFGFKHSIYIRILAEIYTISETINCDNWKY